MTLFDFDLESQVRNIFPPEKRNGSFFHFVYALISPLTTTRQKCQDFEEDVRTRSMYNGQKMVLQAALNQIFNVTSAPFIIIETIRETIDVKYFNNQSEALNPIFAYNQSESSVLYLNNSNEAGSLANNFVVRIPSGIYTTEIERRLRAEVDNYKLFSKNFTVEQY